MCLGPPHRQPGAWGQVCPVRLRVEGRGPYQPEWTGLGPDRPLFPAPPSCRPLSLDSSCSGARMLVPPHQVQQELGPAAGPQPGHRCVRGTFLGAPTTQAKAEGRGLQSSGWLLC